VIRGWPGKARIQASKSFTSPSTSVRKQRRMENSNHS